MSELGIFVDESGGQNGHSKHYGIALVFHNQTESIEERLERHRRGLSDKGIADIPSMQAPL